jgi:hypothetical protein
MLMYSCARLYLSPGRCAQAPISPPPKSPRRSGPPEIPAYSMRSRFRASHDCARGSISGRTAVRPRLGHSIFGVGVSWPRCGPQSKPMCVLTRGVMRVTSRGLNWLALWQAARLLPLSKPPRKPRRPPSPPSNGRRGNINPIHQQLGTRHTPGGCGVRATCGLGTSACNPRSCLARLGAGGFDSAPSQPRE